MSSLSEQLVQGSGEFTFDGHRETQLKGMARRAAVRHPRLGGVNRWMQEDAWREAGLYDPLDPGCGRAAGAPAST